jgi:5-methylcytosine-specific restriction enzyme subunit McrC
MTSSKTPDDPVVLAEYGSALVYLDADQERVLRRLAQGRITIAPGDVTNTWRITASSYVGTLVTPDVRILIIPKVTTANLFYLLEAGGDPVKVGPAAFDYDTTRDLIPSFATFYARHLEKVLSRGVSRAYAEIQERLPGIRGRVDLPAQLRLAGVPIPTECRFDEYTADIRLNRILRGAAARLLRLPGVTQSTRQALQRLVGLLAESGPCTPADLAGPTVFTRLNEHYRSAERLARMVLGNETLLGSTGSAAAGVFLIDMNKVFEQFVAARLSRYLSGRVAVCPQHRTTLDHAGRVQIRPDLVFKSAAGQVVYVADTKYKINADGYGREADYYQILAYATALDMAEGMLIYCQRDGAVPPREIEVGQLKTRLVTVAIGLSGTREGLEQSLAELAEHIHERAELRVSTLLPSIHPAQ